MSNWDDIRNYIENQDPLPSIPEGTELIKVVGLSFVPEYPNNVLSLLASSARNPKVELLRNPDNVYDKNAIEIRYHGQMLGHVPKDIASRLAPELDAGKQYDAVVWQVRISQDNPNNPGLDIVIQESYHGIYN